MSDFQNIDIYSSVTLVDRCGLGGKDAEFQFDGIPFPFVNDEGQAVTEKAFPKFVAEWLFSKNKFQVWTKATDEQPTQFVNRYGIKDCPKAMLELYGVEVADCSPIERDPDVIEGSDAPLFRTEPVRLVKTAIPPNEQPRDRQGRRGNVTTIPAGRS
jgi:hypothetical protein